MRRLSLVSPLLVLLLAGCTHQRVVTPGSEAGFASLNKQAARREATVMLAGGAAHKARALQMTADSTSWLDPKTGAVRQVATGEVVRVRFVKHDRGALEGLAFGLLGGAVLGTVLGKLAGDAPACSMACIFQFQYTAEENAKLGAIGLGLVGAASGFISGFSIGSEEVYQVERAVPPRDRENAAPVSSAAYLPEGGASQRPLPPQQHQAP